MRLSTHETVQRIWTVRLHPQPGGPLLSCPQCTLHGYRLPAASARSVALTHLARHARRDVLPRHLRTCQCRARSCSWHPRHRGCAGPVLLALPCYSSPAVRLLALQCALRADGRGRVRFSSGLLRSMRLHGRAELWSELEHAGWLRCSLPLRPHVEARLLDAAMQTQTSGRSARARAAHWALRPVPLVAPRGMSPAVQLTALVLAAHTSDGVGSTELDILARLGGQSPQQVEDLLDQLVRCRLLAAWQHLREHDEISWRLPEHSAPSSAPPGR